MAARVQAAVELVKSKALKVVEDTKAYAKEKTSQAWHHGEKLRAVISGMFFFFVCVCCYYCLFIMMIIITITIITIVVGTFFQNAIV